MKEDLYGWIRSLAVFYILLTSMLHLVPDKKYDRYVRFFMGMVLMLMTAAPLFALVGKGEELLGSFSSHYGVEEGYRERMETDNLERFYFMGGVAYELEEKVRENLKKRGISFLEAEISLEGEKVRATLTLKEAPSAEEERSIADGMWEACGLQRGDYEIDIQEAGAKTVGGDGASGTSPGGDGSAGFPQQTDSF